MQKGGPRILLYRALGIVMVALGVIGAFLPVMPTTVFLIVAVWAFAKSSPELAEKIRNHPRFGPPVRRWEERRAIPRAAKTAAVVSMAGSAAIVWLLASAWVGAGVSAVLICVAAYVVSRPSA